MSHVVVVLMSFVVECMHSITEFSSLVNSLIMNNEGQMCVRCKYKRCIQCRQLH